MKKKTLGLAAFCALSTLLAGGIALAGGLAGSDASISAGIAGTPTVVVSGTPTIYVVGTNGLKAGVSVAGAAAASNAPALIVGLSPNSPLGTGANVIGAVNQNQTLDKTNDSIAISYRARTMLTFTAAQIAGTTSDTLIASFTKNAAGATTGSVGSYVITNAATLRITSICFSNRAGAAAAVNTVFNLRYNTAGACTASSGLVGTWDIAAPSNISGDGAELCVPTGEGGLEFLGDGTGAICWSHLSSATTNVETITALGYEYTKP